MATNTDKSPFFIGYMNAIPKGLGLFLMLAIVGFLGGMGATAFFASANISDPGNGNPRWDLGRQELIGRLEYTPYPVLRVPAQDGDPARAFMLAGVSKVGVLKRAREFEDSMVRVEGIMVERGDMSMLQVVGARRGLQNADEYNEYSPADYHPPAAKKLGKWRLTGEICDGKCYAGAMRPGRGLAHKACANLCLFDGVPPVFVSESPVDGSSFFMLADKNGKLLGKEISPLIALYITAEGDVERIDDLLIFRIDLDSVVVE